MSLLGHLLLTSFSRIVRVRRRARQPAGEVEDARTEDFRAHQFQDLRIDRVLEEPLAFAHDYGEDHEPVLVDEVVPHKRVDEVGAAKGVAFPTSSSSFTFAIALCICLAISYPPSLLTLRKPAVS